MKRTLLAVLALAAASFVLTGAERDGRGKGRGGVRVERSSTPRSPGRASAPSKVYRQRRISIPRAAMPSSQGTVRDRSRPVYPRRSETGAPIRERPAAAPPREHASVVRNPAVVRDIRAQRRVEVVPKHYYWHNDRGVRYSHYYDGRHHWYGFYNGPRFYWTRYHDDRWWWYDPLALRWVFWWNGFWWWPGPGGAAYVYVDNGYYPYEDSGVTVERVEEQAPPAEMPAANAGATTNSPDGSRMVQIFGTDGQAFLYDKTKSPPLFLKYLGQGVDSVRYSGGTAGAPLRILVEYKDNTFALFDADGDSESAEVKATESKTPAPPEAPESIPPPPTSAPGQ